MANTDFNTYKYFYPPRPEEAIPQALIQFYENRGWQAQIKRNGTNNLIFVSPKHELRFMTRHAVAHKGWHPESAPERSFKPFKKLPHDGKWYVFNSELLHSKTPKIKNTNFLFDLYVYKGQKLDDLTFAERYELLFNLFKKQIIGETDYHWVINEHTWIAKNFSDNLTDLFRDLDAPEDEGLVLKNPTAKLV